MSLWDRLKGRKSPKEISRVLSTIAVAMNTGAGRPRSDRPAGNQGFSR